MNEPAVDPYAVLGVASDISDIELRRVYRGLVKRHHPDHNGGSAESARRFAQIQRAYAAIAERRRGPCAAGDASASPGPAAPQAASPGPAAPQAASPGPAAPQAASPGPAASQDAPAGADPIEDRVASLERELAAMRAAEQRRARDQARLAREQAAKLAAAQRSRAIQAHRLHATPEELGYYSTDDSFTRIVDDAAEQLGQRLHKSEAKRQFARRLSDLFGRDA